MNRQILSKAKFGVREGVFRNAQSWLLAPAQSRGPAAVNGLQAQAQRTLLLQSFSAFSDQPGGTINANGLRVAGLSLNISDQPIPIGCFSPTAGGTAKAHTTIGIAISQNTSVSVDAVQSAGGNFGYAIGALPLEGQIPSTEAQADYYAYVCGLGTTGVVAPGNTGTCQAVVLRGGWLGLVSAVNMLGTAVIADSDCVLTDLTINGISQLAGGPTQQISMDFLNPNQSSTDDYILNVYVEPNSIITATFANVNGAAANMDVGMAIFCKPYKKPSHAATHSTSPTRSRRLTKQQRG